MGFYCIFQLLGLYTPQNRCLPLANPWGNFFISIFSHLPGEQVGQKSTFSNGVILYIVRKEISCTLILSLESGSENQYFGYFAVF
jgi:hypothetical protein